MRPSEKIGKIIVRTLLFLAGIFCSYMWVKAHIYCWNEGDGLILLPLWLDFSATGIYLGVCIKSIETYHRHPNPKNLPKYNILWPIVKWLDRNYKEN